MISFERQSPREGRWRSGGPPSGIRVPASALAGLLPGTTNVVGATPRPSPLKAVAGSISGGHFGGADTSPKRDDMPGSSPEGRVKPLPEEGPVFRFHGGLFDGPHPVRARGQYLGNALRTGHRPPIAESSSPLRKALRGVSSGSTFAMKSFRRGRPLRTRHGGEP